MTEAQRRGKELRDQISRGRQRLIELSKAETLTDESRAELDEIERTAPDLERQVRAAELAAESD